jgi:hypothetical protein
MPGEIYIGRPTAPPIAAEQVTQAPLTEESRRNYLATLRQLDSQLDSADIKQKKFYAEKILSLFGNWNPQAQSLAADPEVAGIRTKAVQALKSGQ